MSSLYAITSFCAIILIVENKLEGGGVLFDGWEPELGFVPTVLYCGLITLTIIPFSLIRVEKLKNITCTHPHILLIFIGLLLAESLLNFYLVADSTLDILNGDLSAVRESHYADDASLAEIKAESLPFVLRLLNYLSFSTILALPLFFYYSCVKKRSLWITSVLLFISLSCPLKAIQAVDRAELVLYGEMFLFCVVFFRKLFTAAIKRLFIILGIPFVAIAVIYLTSVSSARFEETDEGTTGSVLQYAGQSYLNFCYFYDNAKQNLIYPEREIPIISHIFLKSDYREVKDERSAKEGFFIGVFATHIGAWILDIGLVGCIVYSMLYVLICVLLIKYFNRTTYEITEVLLIFILATVPIFGIFYYRFHSFHIALQYVFAGLLYLMSKYKVVWRKN